MNTPAIYTHAELVEKLEEAQLEIRRLMCRPDQSLEIKKLQDEIQRLRDHNAEILKQRNDLFAIVKRYQDEGK